MNRRRGLQIYIGFVGCLAAAVVVAAVAALWHMTPSTWLPWLPQAGLFVALAWVAGRNRVHISESSMHVMSSTVLVAMLLIFPYPLAILAIGVSKVTSELIFPMGKKGLRWRALLVNTGATLLANAVAGGAFVLLRGSTYLWSGSAAVFMAFPALAALAVAFPLVELLVVAGAIMLSSEDRPVVIVRNLTRGAVLPELSLILVGIVFAVVWHASPILSFLLIVPMVFSIRSFESVARLRKETVEAVLKMAESIDYRDTGTYEHSQRLADFSRRLATALQLSPDHVSDVILAARVHDLGKIGISNDILLKTGPLTEEERRIMEQHPVIGATILSSYSQFQGSVAIVRHHHERWDGKGYPDRVKGEEIPLGARIITVVDSFDAMTEDRPYRKGMSVDMAVERLKGGMGTQFDPRVCAVFIQLLIEDGTYVPATVETAPTLRIVPRRASSG